MKGKTTQRKKKTSRKTKPNSKGKMHLNPSEITTELSHVRTALKKSPENKLLQFEEKMLKALNAEIIMKNKYKIPVLNSRYRELTRIIGLRYELFLLINGLRTNRLPRKERAFKILEKYRNHELFSQIEEKLKEHYSMK
jgi:hypothetical protein